jgi:hypothetical protein
MYLVRNNQRLSINVGFRSSTQPTEFYFLGFMEKY